MMGWVSSDVLAVCVLTATNDFDTIGDSEDSVDSLSRFLRNLLLIVTGHVAPQDDDPSADFDVEIAQRQVPRGAQCSCHRLHQIAVGDSFQSIGGDIRNDVDRRFMAGHFENGSTSVGSAFCVKHDADCPFIKKGMVQ